MTDRIGIALKSGVLVTYQPGECTGTQPCTAGNASINFPPGTAPTSPADGDVWVTAAGLFVQIASATIGPMGPACPAITASVNLTAGQIVNIFSSSGAAEVRPADIVDDTKGADGFVLAAVTSGNPATVYGRGSNITGLSGLTPGATYWLASSGALTATEPSSGWRQVVGKALSATTLRFDPDQGDLL